VNRSRALAVFLCLSTALWAQGKAFHIGVTQVLEHAALDADERGFEDALASEGFTDGGTVIYDRQNALGDPAKAAAIIQRFVDEKVDLVHSLATVTTQAAVNGAKRIPIVFSSVTDPVSAGIVPPGSVPGTRTGTNVTGVSDMWPVLLQLQTYVKFVPKARTWGTIYNPAEANSVIHVRAMREAAARLGLKLVEATVAGGNEVEQAAKSLAGKVQAINITSDNTAVSQFDTIVAICNQKKIPLFSGDVDSAARGAIAAYGLDYYLVGYSAGKKAALILKGGKPGDIPWGPIEKFSLVINQRAAAAQGITIPPALLRIADKVIK